MPRNVEIIQKQFGSNEPLPQIELAGNALRLGGRLASAYLLKEDLAKEAGILLGGVEEVLKALEVHVQDDVRHLTDAQIKIIESAINATKALEIANKAINEAKAGIVTEAVQEAVQQSKEYTDAEIANKLGELNLPTVVDPETGEEKEQNIAETLVEKPQNIINPEYFYRFKNMIDNSSFEVFDGNTFRPLGWDNGVVSEDASMFETHSLKLTAGQVSKQLPAYQADMMWLKGAYDTSDAILCFYHKFDAVKVRIWDVTNEDYLTLTALDSSLAELGTGTAIEFPYEANWNKYRCMVKFTPKSTTTFVRVELTCVGGNKNECYIDAISLEPFVAGEYPSIYKPGKYSISANQLVNPPPDDVTRFTALEHLVIANGVADDKGNLTHQEYNRTDGTLAIVREASNPDENGYYQTIVETFYKRDGSVLYTDTYTYTYSKTGAIISKTFETTEVN